MLFITLLLPVLALGVFGTPIIHGRATVETRTGQSSDGEDMWAVEKRADPNPDGPINYCQNHPCYRWAVEKRASPSTDGEDIWAVEKRAYQSTDGEDIWAVEKRASQSTDGEDIWAVEKRAP